MDLVTDTMIRHSQKNPFAASNLKQFLIVHARRVTWRRSQVWEGCAVLGIGIYVQVSSNLVLLFLRLVVIGHFGKYPSDSKTPSPSSPRRDFLDFPQEMDRER